MRLKIHSLFSLSSFILDGLAVAVSFHSANWIRFESGWIEVRDPVVYPHYGAFLAFIVGVHWLSFKYLGLYRKRRGVSTLDELSKVLRAVLAASVLILACTFLIKFFEFSRLVIGISGALTVAAVWMERMALRRIQVSMRRRGFGLTRVLVVGSGDSARTLLQRLRQNPGLGYRIVGVVSEAKASGSVEGNRIVGDLSRFTELTAKLDPHEVIFALPASAHGKIIPLLVSLQDTGIRYKIVSDLFGLITNPLTSDVLMGLPVFEMKEAPLGDWHNQALKRAFDLWLSALGLLILSPFLLLLAAGVRFSSPGPIFFRQERVGRDGRVFEMLKFRSMRSGTQTVAFTAKDDPRVTPFGRFLRRASLDELPQLFNVLKGEMSLVGPRPEVPGLVEKFGKEIPRYFERHQVKSGITGWAQVNRLRGNTSLEERVKYDIYYIENWSLFFDVKIILRTLLDLFEHEHAY